jgi:hypothetical protein
MAIGALAAPACHGHGDPNRDTRDEVHPPVVSTTDRIVMASNGRWELHGDGRATPY